VQVQLLPGALQNDVLVGLSGCGRRPLEPEIVGSNPTQDTDSQVVERQTRQAQNLVPTGHEGSIPSLATDSGVV
jgi:hypothetical protein